jgi:thymidine phosphorylase
VAAGREPAIERCRAAIASGNALERFRRVVMAQGGDGKVCDEPEAVLPRATRIEAVRADRGGYVVRLRAAAVGQAAMHVGAGRATVDAQIDPAAGVVLRHTLGERVAAGDVLAEVHFNPPHAGSVPTAVALLREAITVGDAAPPPQPRILARL